MMPIKLNNIERAHIPVATTTGHSSVAPAIDQAPSVIAVPQ